jgi:hypothetical protein
MSNVLTLQVDTSGNVKHALINGEDVGEVVSVSQNLVRGSLQGALTLKFTEVTVEAAPPEAPTAITATFVGSETDIVITITAPTLGSGNRFAYKFVSPMATVPAAPNKGDVISGTTNMTGNSATVNQGADGDGYLLYELDSQNKVVSYLGHKLVSGEFIQS